MTKEETKLLMLEFRRGAETANREDFKRMSKCERFKIGKQWDSQVEQSNTARRKFSLTINRCLPIVLQLDGREAQDRREAKVLSKRGSSKTVARLLTVLVKQIADTSHSSRQKSLMFDNGVTTGRGWIGIDFDYSHDPLNSDLVIKQYDPFMVLPDKRRDYDLNKGAKFVIVDEWRDKAEIEALYPGKKRLLEGARYASAAASAGMVSRATAALSDMFFGGSAGVRDDYRNRSSEDGGDPNELKAKYNYRVSTYWWKEWKKGAYIQHRESPMNYIPLTKASEIKAAQLMAAQYPEALRFIDKDHDGLPLTVSILHRTRMIGDVMLDTKEDPLDGIHLFPIVPFSAYYQNGYEFGIIENLIGPQEQVNWSWSTELNIMKGLANSGWYVNSKLKKLASFLRHSGSEDGIVIEVGNPTDVRKIEQNQFPLSFDVATEKGSTQIAEISNVRLENPSTDKDRVASAIQLKQAASRTGDASIFSNYDWTIELLAELVVAVTQRVRHYSREEILTIAEDGDLLDALLMSKARAMAYRSLEEAGTPMVTPQDLAQPIPLQPTDFKGNKQFAKMEPVDQALQVAAVNNARVKEFAALAQQTKVLNDRFDEEHVKPIALNLILKDLHNLGKGRYTLKVALGPEAETIKIVKSLENMELHKVLIESGLPGLTREQLIEAVDPHNKEEILASPPPPVAQSEKAA